MGGAWQQEERSAEIQEFLRMLAVCHTVLPEGEESLNAIKYQVLCYLCFLGPRNSPQGDCVQPAVSAVMWAAPSLDPTSFSACSVGLTFWTCAFIGFRF